MIFFALSRPAAAACTAPALFLLTLLGGSIGCSSDDKTPSSTGDSGGADSTVSHDSGTDDAMADAPGDANAGASADAGEAGNATTPDAGGSGDAAVTGLAKIDHFVVIYMENHSFDNLYGEFPGAEGLSSIDGGTSAATQLGGDGGPYGTLPFPASAAPFADAAVANGPFPIQQFYPPDQNTIDLHHIFFTEQFQISDGGMNKFAYFSDALGFSMGYWHTMKLPIPAVAQQFTLCDHFFHAAFGGSFLNHFWLIAARTPEWASAAPPDAGGPSIDDPNFVVNNPGTSEGQVTADGFAVNTSFSVNQPHPAGIATTKLVPNQTFDTIGDRLSAAGVDWAWYAGGWNDAIAFTSSDGGTVPPNWGTESYQYHHQPFIYFAKYADGTPAKAQHLKDEQDFIAAAQAGTLPGVSFVKPVGKNNEHPGYTDLVDGENHLLSLIEAVQNSPNWPSTAIVITYDEHGGQWDHVPPPSVDRWGPGLRVPTIVISPFAKKGHVDKTVYDTTSILKTIELRWTLQPLTDRDKNVNDMTPAFDFAR